MRTHRAFAPLPACLQHLTGGLPDVSGLPQLEALVLSDNELTGGLPKLPGGMRHVNLERNSFG